MVGTVPANPTNSFDIKSLLQRTPNAPRAARKPLFDMNQNKVRLSNDCATHSTGQTPIPLIAQLKELFD